MTRYIVRVQFSENRLLQLFKKQAELCLTLEEQAELVMFINGLHHGNYLLKGPSRDVLLAHWAEFITLPVVNDRKLRRRASLCRGDLLVLWPCGMTTCFFDHLGNRVQVNEFLRQECSNLPLHLIQSQDEDCGWQVNVVVPGSGQIC